MSASISRFGLVCGCFFYVLHGGSTKAVIIDDFVGDLIRVTPPSTFGTNVVIDQFDLPAETTLGGERRVVIDGSSGFGNAAVSIGGGSLQLESPGSYGLTLNYRASSIVGANLLHGGADRFRLDIGDSYRTRRWSVQIRVESNQVGYGLAGSTSTVSYFTESTFGSGPLGAQTIELPFSLFDDQRVLSSADRIVVSLDYGFDGDGSTPQPLADAAFELTSIQTAAPPLQGDFDRDGEVTLEDFDRWSASRGASLRGFLTADGNGDSRVDAADYTIWRDAYQANQSAEPVPEPSASFVAVSVFLAGGWRRVT